MFPLFDIEGRPVGFSGRYFDKRKPDTLSTVPPKYVNTPETAIYHKSELLYGLHTAKRSIREKGRAVLVEGQFDLILSHQADVTETVATSGTALTEDHIRTLKRFTKEIRAAFDSDAAGEATSERVLRLLLQNDMNVLVIRSGAARIPPTS